MIFCSGKNRNDPASELHTSFRLRSTGEFFGLVQPDGATSTVFQPFPTQVAYASYGIKMGETSNVIAPGADVAYFVPDSDALGTTWTELDFDDAAWARGPGPVGYDRKTTTTYDGLIATDLTDTMDRINSTIYMRMPFEVADAGALDTLIARVRFEDGMAIYLNGMLVAAENTPDDLTWESRASRSRRDDDALQFMNVNLTPFLDQLVNGTNVLAIHGLNRSTSNTDYFFQLEMDSVQVDEVSLDINQYFASPSPGWANGSGVDSIADAPEFVTGSRAFVDPVQP